MNTYFNTILTVSLVGGIISSFVPERSGLKKYIGYIISLVIILCLVSPLTSILTSTIQFKESINNFLDKISVSEDIEKSNSLIINSSKEKISNGIKEVIIQKYKFDESEVIVDLILDTEEIDSIRVERVLVTLTGKSSWSDVGAVKEYLNNIIGTETEVRRK